MRGQRLTQETILKWFLATVLLSAGMIAGVRFSGNDSTPDEIVSIEEAPTINISGEWVGTMTDSRDERRSNYRVVFEHDGNNVTGILYQTALNSNSDVEFYLETSVSGTIEGDRIFYWADELLVLEGLQAEGICLLQTTVTFEQVDNQDILIGTWESQANQPRGCEFISGHTMLTRQPE
ncbi:MAG: hypothetical protein Phog2KO_49870 [Phototrophicaceae bacterium]